MGLWRRAVHVLELVLRTLPKVLHSIDVHACSWCNNLHRMVDSVVGLTSLLCYLTVCLPHWSDHTVVPVEFVAELLAAASRRGTSIRIASCDVVSVPPKTQRKGNGRTRWPRARFGIATTDSTDSSIWTTWPGPLIGCWWARTQSVHRSRWKLNATRCWDVTRHITQKNVNIIVLQHHVLADSEPVLFFEILLVPSLKFTLYTM